MNSAINTGVDTQIEIIDDIILQLVPISKTVASLMNIIVELGYYSIIVVLSLCIFISIGMWLRRKDFINKKNINKITDPINNYVRMIAGSFSNAILNGRGKTVQGEIVDNTTYISRNYTIQRTKKVLLYTILEILSSVSIVVSLIVVVRNIEHIEQIVPIYNCVNNVNDYAWWIFHGISNIIEQAASWASLEVLLESYEQQTKETKTELKELSDYIPLLKKQVKSIRISGESGCGKSVFMRQLVKQLYLKHHVCWIYLDQNMDILRSEMITVRQFMSHNIPNSVDRKLVENKLIEMSEFLKISVVINKETLDSPFCNPSFGQVKRIMILRSLLPILLDCVHIRFIFADEVTAGLDTENWKIVQELFNLLMTKYNITMVSIDHHPEFKADVNLEAYIVESNKVDKIEEKNVSTKSCLSRFYGDVDVIAPKTKINSSPPIVSVKVI
jgi:ABC-type lipoprotein export system ATPase subunit